MESVRDFLQDRRVNNKTLQFWWTQLEGWPCLIWSLTFWWSNTDLPNSSREKAAIGFEKKKEKWVFPVGSLTAEAVFLEPVSRINCCYRAVVRSDFNCFHMFHQIAIGSLCVFNVMHLKCERVSTGTRLRGKRQGLVPSENWASCLITSPHTVFNWKELWVFVLEPLQQLLASVTELDP